MGGGGGRVFVRTARVEFGALLGGRVGRGRGWTSRVLRRGWLAFRRLRGGGRGLGFLPRARARRVFRGRIITISSDVAYLVNLAILKTGQPGHNDRY